jgi:Flp pilus assembly protein TadB
VLLLAPVIFVCHFLEEAPGFVDWFNAHVARGITEPLFRQVNLTALVITIAVVALEWLTPSTFSAVAVVAWFSFLFLANALLHVVGALHDRAYVPGLVTAVALYVPFGVWLIRRMLQTRRLHGGTVATAAVLGALPMLVHGYLIIFRGSRLF